MKKAIRIITLVLAISCLFSAFGVMASAEGLKSGGEKLGGVPKSQKDQQKVREIYEDVIYRAYQFDEDILLPELEHMNSLDNIKIKFVQGKRGTVRGQSIYEGPYDGAKDRWYVKDGAKVKVYARYNDYYFCEVMLNDNESEGTIGWIPTTYTVNKWDPEVSRIRTRQFGG